MFEEQLKQRDLREYKQLEPVLDEISRLKAVIEKYENSTQSDAAVQELKAKLQALTEERAALYKGQSATASKLLDLNERLESVTQERNTLQAKVEELEVKVKELQVIILRGEFESVQTGMTLKEQMLPSELLQGVLHGDSWFGWTGSEFLLNGTMLPTKSDSKPVKLFLNNAMAIAALQDCVIVVWGRATCRIKHILQGGPPILTLAVEGDATLVTVHPECIKVWDLRHGSCVRTINCRMDDKAWLFLENNRIMVLLGRGKLKIFSMDGDLLKNTQLCKSINCGAYCDEWLAVGTGESVVLYNKLKQVKSESARGVKMLSVSGTGSLAQLYEVEGKWYLKKTFPITLGSDAALDMYDDIILFPNHLVRIKY